MKVRNFWIGWAATGLLLLPAVGWAAGVDAVYQREQPNGAVSLTNVPDSDAYQVLVAAPATGPGAAPAPAAVAASPAHSLERPMVSAAAVQPNGDSPDAQRQQLATVPPAPDEPAAMRSQATAVAGQAFQDITAAGGASARLQAMYEASRSAFSGQRPAAQGR